MASQILGPRKQRTRAHVIADLSVYHVEGFILEEGHTAQRLSSDYGYDLIMWSFDEDGYAEPGSIYFQLKGMEKLQEHGTHYVCALDVRDYNLWIVERDPVILVLFDASRKRAYWVCIQRLTFAEIAARLPKKRAKTVRLRVSRRQLLNRRAIARIRNLKRQTEVPTLRIMP